MGYEVVRDIREAAKSIILSDLSKIVFDPVDTKQYYVEVLLPAKCYKEIPIDEPRKQLLLTTEISTNTVFQGRSYIRTSFRY